MHLTTSQFNLYKRSRSEGPVVCFARELNTARALEKKGYGRVVSNPGANYVGTKPDPARGRGGYFVANNWKFSQGLRGYVLTTAEDVLPKTEPQKMVEVLAKFGYSEDGGGDHFSSYSKSNAESDGYTVLIFAFDEERGGDNSHWVVERTVCGNDEFNAGGWTAATLEKFLIKQVKV